MTDLLAHFRHLIVRFFEVVTARPPDPGEQTEIADLIRGDMAALFWSQPAADQRHGLTGARAVLAAAPGRVDLARAALLHDVGKRRSGLGAVGRSVASLFGVAGLAPPGRIRTYLDHGGVGAADLEAAGAEPVVVLFARHHHDGAAPEQIPRDEWELLVASDHE